MPPTASIPPPPGVVAGVDYGTVRIGVALTDRERRIAAPHQTYTRKSETADAAWFRELARENGVTLFVVGLPVHLHGGESQKSFEARKFGEWLTQQTGVPVEFYDERFTTVEAEHYLLEAGLTKKRRKARLDKLAAQIMLAAWLERGAADRPPQSLDD